MNEQLHQRANTSGIEESHSTHIEDEVRGRFRPHGLQKVADRFEAELSFQPDNRVISVGVREFFELQSGGFHKPRRLTQNPPLLQRISYFFAPSPRKLTLFRLLNQIIVTYQCRKFPVDVGFAQRYRQATARPSQNSKQRPFSKAEEDSCSGEPLSLASDLL